MRSLGTLLCLICLLLVFPFSSPAHQWSRAEEIPGLKSFTGSVTAAWHDGVLHVVTNDRSKNVKHVRRVDGKWIAPVSLAHHRSGLVPDLAVCGGTLHMVGNPGSFKIWHSRWDGRAWRDPEVVVAMETRARVEITGLDGVLHLTHGGKNMERKRIFHAANAGWGWGHNYPLPDQTARFTASMAGLNGVLHMVYVSKNSFTAWHTSLTRWGEWTPPVQIPGVETRRYVDLVAAKGRLFMVFTTGTAKNGRQAPVAFCEWSGGRWSTPEILEGYVCYGFPALAVEPGLPSQIHLLLPSRVGVLHMQTRDKVKLAPVKMKTVTPAN